MTVCSQLCERNFREISNWKLQLENTFCHQYKESTDWRLMHFSLRVLWVCHHYFVVWVEPWNVHEASLRKGIQFYFNFSLFRSVRFCLSFIIILSPSSWGSKKIKIFSRVESETGSVLERNIFRIFGISEFRYKELKRAETERKPERFLQNDRQKYTNEHKLRPLEGL